MTAHALHSGREGAAPRRSWRPEERWRGERPWPASALAPGAREEDAFHHQASTVSLSFARHEVLVIAGLVVGLLILALIVALILARFVGAGALLLIPLVAVYAALLTAPVWIAAIVDDAEAYAGSAEAEREERADG